MQHPTDESRGSSDRTPTPMSSTASLPGECLVENINLEHFPSLWPLSLGLRAHKLANPGWASLGRGHSDTTTLCRKDSPRIYFLLNLYFALFSLLPYVSVLSSFFLPPNFLGLHNGRKHTVFSHNFNNDTIFGSQLNYFYDIKQIFF